MGKNMIFEEYRKQTSQMNCYPENFQDSQCGILLMGLAEELIEFQMAKGHIDSMVSEIGDVSWYVAELCNLISYSPKLDVYTMFDFNIPLEMAKKAISLNKKYYRGDYDCIKRLEGIKLLCDNAHSFIDGFNRKYDCYRKNIDKLTQRLAKNTIRGEGENRDKVD